MNFNDLSHNDEILICVNNFKQKFEIKSNIVKIDNILYIKALYYKEKLLNFDSNKLKIELIYLRGDKQPIVWNNAKLVLVNINNNKYYKVILLNNVGKELNRRDSFRLSLAVEGTVQKDGKNTTKDILIKNISQSGFAFISEEVFDCGEAVIIGFDDRMLNIKIKLRGTIIRKRINDKKLFEYGCELFNKKNNDIASYINQKQRHLLSRTNGFKR